MENYLPYIWILAMVAMFYFLIIKPQKKKEKEDEDEDEENDDENDDE